MALFAGAGREELRRAWVEAWRKHREGRPLEPLEAQLADLVAAHPEYHAVLEAGAASESREWTPEGGQSNPFLHLGLHMAVREGVATDRPPGLRAAFSTIAEASGSAHEAEHRLLDCLAETLWEAQRERRAPDESAFLARVRRLATRR